MDMKNFDSLLEDFKVSLDGTDKSKNTIITYQKAVIEFNGFMDSGYKEIHAQEFKGIVEFKQVEPLHIDRYRDYCKEKGNKASTINNKLTSVSRFFNNMIRKKVVKYNPVAGVERPKNKQGKPTDSLTPAEVNKLMKTVRLYKGYNAQKHHVIRDYTMMHMFLALGLRASELATLKISDTDLGRRVIWFLGKGGDMETMPLPDALVDNIQVYLKQRNNLHIKPEFKDVLFISNKGTQYSIQALNRKIKLYVDEAEISKDIHTHSLRHTFAVNSYAITKDILGLQEAMRHSDPSTTAIYTGQDDERVRAVVDANTYGGLSW